MLLLKSSMRSQHTLVTENLLYSYRKIVSLAEKDARVQEVSVQRVFVQGMLTEK
jgi:hypothetical protein